VDILGYLPGENQPVVSPAEALEKLVQENPQHPYAIVGLDQVTEALKAFQDLCRQAGYPMEGSLERNWLLPTALGTLRPTCLAPKTMTSGDASQLEAGKTLIAGFDSFPDFYPAWTAGNLAAQGYPAQSLLIEMESLCMLRFVTGRVLAQKFDEPEFRAEVAAAIQPYLGEIARVGLPAVLGLRNPLEVLHDLEARLGVPVFEIPTLPPSIPGIRLHNLLVDTLQKSGARVFDGMLATGCEHEGGRIQRSG
jgi:glycerol-3-phosphate dehydrogenase subunit B